VTEAGPKIGVCVPCYRVRQHIGDVLGRIGPEVSHIFVIDDACPEKSGQWVREHCADPRVQVIENPANLGVGGAVLRGYAVALELECDVIVKIDGDGQMDPAMLARLISPIVRGQADYCKGNRFFELESLAAMPAIRIVGNSVLSFMSKLSTGYWGLFDPNNGYTAIHSSVAALLPAGKISNRYFFETDMLFRLNTLRAVVVDVPMPAVYGTETSSLREWQVVGEFAIKHIRNFCKRIFYNYFLRDMSLASLELVVGTLLLLFGTVYGAVNWVHALRENVMTPLGVIMLPALTVLVGLQLVLAFLGFDIASVPRRPVHTDLVAGAQKGTGPGAGS
jgi:dolichol-phosphate mannosyltransferase